MDFLRQFILLAFQTIKQLLRRLTRPSGAALVPNAAIDLTRSRTELILENALLRQQLIVVSRQVKRPALTWRDRALFVLLASKLRTWKQALLIVQPETLLRWHRDLFRRVWRRKSRPKSKPGRPPLADDVVALIKRIARENHSWGAKRIRGELKKLGIDVAKSTIQRYVRDVRVPLASKQTWASFLRNHANQIWACDFSEFRIHYPTIPMSFGMRLGRAMCAVCRLRLSNPSVTALLSKPNYPSLFLHRLRLSPVSALLSTSLMKVRGALFLKGGRSC